MIISLRISPKYKMAEISSPGVPTKSWEEQAKNVKVDRDGHRYVHRAIVEIRTANITHSNIELEEIIRFILLKYTNIQSNRCYNL